MPLVKGTKAKTKKGKAENMRMLKEEGKPRKQQIAIMMSEAGESKKSKRKSKKGKY
jgi:hypothetical protein